ncbi:MAG TPA: L,D-transpeptidase [Gaiellaceae bacterium]|nr:L,D-transpeptidase [Gaiellaceae bacterium]
MRRALALAALPLLAAGCGAARTAAPPPTATTTATTHEAKPPAARAPRRGVKAAHAVRCAPGTRHLGSARLAYAAVVPEHATAYRAPGGRPFAEFDAENVNDYPTVLGVRARRVEGDCSVRWYRVQLPIRPNGVTGWVRARDVVVQPVRTRIVVDLSQRRLTLYRGGKRVLSSPVAIGSRATPTPTGSYYVNQRLVPDDVNGPFGPAALGVSAYSDVLTGWAQGGPIGIHGTNEPWSIGRDVSNGCIRLPNATLRRLFRLAFAGTPVLIRR